MLCKGFPLPGAYWEAAGDHRLKARTMGEVALGWLAGFCAGAVGEE